MEIISRMSYGLIVLSSVVFAIFMPAAVQGQSHRIAAPAQAPGPTSDGYTLDQGIACALMLLALLLTYIIHAADVPFLP